MRQTYTYDAENRLGTAATDGTTTPSATYDYDALGRRVSKTGSGTTPTYFLLDGDEEIAEYSDTGVLQRRYIMGPAIDDRIARAEGNATSNPPKTYYHINHQGSVIATANPNGSIAQQLAYDEYGNLTSQAPAATTGEPFRYTGRRYDRETNLYYYRARYYSPELGRFLQVDPVGYKDDVNLYAYVKNDPLNNVDPTGLELVVSGSKEFEKKVTEQLAKLEATPTGKEVVTTLTESKNTFEIKENKGSSFATPTNRDDAQNGKGSEGTINHDPDWTPAVDTPKGSLPTPSEVVLGHELSHAVDYDKGTLDRTVNPATGARRSEEKAMGVENKIRKEMGLPERRQY